MGAEAISAMVALAAENAKVVDESLAIPSTLPNGFDTIVDLASHHLVTVAYPAARLLSALFQNGMQSHSSTTFEQDTFSKELTQALLTLQFSKQMAHMDSLVHREILHSPI